MLLAAAQEMTHYTKCNVCSSTSNIYYMQDQTFLDHSNHMKPTSSVSAKATGY